MLLLCRSSLDKSIHFSPQYHQCILCEETLFRFINEEHAFDILGDEVLIIQDKLEAIKARYKDITKLSTDVDKTLEQALQLARRLHSTHEELCTWLDKVEVELLTYETQVLKGEAASQAQVRQKVCIFQIHLLGSLAHTPMKLHLSCVFASVLKDALVGRDPTKTSSLLRDY